MVNEVVPEENLTPCEGFHGQQCSNKVAGYVPQMCCDGRECGCMGRPIEPCWCDECWAKWKAYAATIPEPPCLT